MNYKFGTTKKPDKHEHSFDSVKVVNLILDREKIDKTLPERNRFGGIGTDLPTLGQIKPLAILVRYCSCSEEEAFELCERKQAEERLELILERG